MITIVFKLLLYLPGDQVQEALVPIQIHGFIVL